MTLFTKDNKQTLKGITYQLDDFKIASGKLGHDFMPAGLAERGLVYLPQAPVPKPSVQELPAELVQYLRDALDNFVLMHKDKSMDALEREWRDWLKRDPQAAVAWCSAWIEGEDAGPIPVDQAQQHPELTQEDKEWLDMPSPDPDQPAVRDDQSPEFGR